jgi:hypothetical protein
MFTFAVAKPGAACAAAALMASAIATATNLVSLILCVAPD